MNHPIFQRLRSLKKKATIDPNLSMEEQERHIQRIAELFPKGIPLWVEREIEFPITTAYVDDLQQRLDLHKGWNEELFIRRQQLLPRYRKQLPILPPAPTHEEITQIVQQYRETEDLVGNGLWRMFYRIFLQPPEALKYESYSGFLYVCTFLQFCILSCGVFASFINVYLIFFPAILFFILSVIICVLGTTRKNKTAVQIGWTSLIPCISIILISILLGIGPSILPYILLPYLICMIPVYTKTLFSKPVPQV